MPNRRPNRSKRSNARHHRRPPRGREKAEAEQAPAEMEIPADGVRLNRYIARAGVCSRRKADGLIETGQVTVNDRPAEVGQSVFPGDTVKVRGRAISPRPFVYLLLNKPSDTITTVTDERDRTTVLDLVDLEAEEKDALFPVGRLDRHTVGALLLTTDGELAHRLMHPSYTIEKIYLVRTREDVTPEQLQALKEGVELDDGPARADQVSYAASQEPNEIALMLHEGRNRQVRRMLAALGHEVEHLERIQYAGLTTRGLRRGKWRRLEPHEVTKLRRQVKLK